MRTVNPAHCCARSSTPSSRPRCRRPTRGLLGPWPSTGATRRASPDPRRQTVSEVQTPRPRGAIANAGLAQRTTSSSATTSRPRSWCATRAAPASLNWCGACCVSSCHVDPVPAFVDSLEALATSGVALGDVLADSGYAHRRPEHLALSLAPGRGRPRHGSAPRRPWTAAAPMAVPSRTTATSTARPHHRRSLHSGPLARGREQ